MTAAAATKAGKGGEDGCAMTSSQGSHKKPPSQGSVGKGDQASLLQGNLLEHVVAETWLLERLKQQGLDVYAHSGPFAALRDRLAQVIADNRFGPVLVGRHNGKPETYEQLLLRVFDIKLKTVPRGTNSTNSKQSTG